MSKALWVCPGENCKATTSLQILKERLYRHVQDGYLHTLDKDTVITIIQEVFKRVADDTRCNNSCKWMYFCDRRRGHKGKHRSQGLNWEETK